VTVPITNSSAILLISLGVGMGCIACVVMLGVMRVMGLFIATRVDVFLRVCQCQAVIHGCRVCLRCGVALDLVRR